MCKNPLFTEQLSKPLHNVLEYIPSKYATTSEEDSDRDFIISFKNGNIFSSIRAAKMISQLLADSFSRLDNVVFAPVPASNFEKNFERYYEFCNMVCQYTGMLNGFQHIKVSGERVASHFFKNKIPSRNLKNIKFDSNWFNGKDVIVFDDVITEGSSYAIFSNALEDCGANVWGGCFLGRTFKKKDLLGKKCEKVKTDVQLNFAF